VFNVQNSYNPHAVPGRGVKSASLICYLTGSLLGDIAGFGETVTSGLLADVSLSVRRRFRFQHYRAPARDGQDIRQWLNATHP
jgi:hypothetical protein